MDGRADGRTDGRTNGRTDGRADGRADERTGGRSRAGGRTDGGSREAVCLSACLPVCICSACTLGAATITLKKLPLSTNTGNVIHVIHVVQQEVHNLLDVVADGGLALVMHLRAATAIPIDQKSNEMHTHTQHMKLSRI